MICSQDDTPLVLVKSPKNLVPTSWARVKYTTEFSMLFFFSLLVKCDIIRLTVLVQDLENWGSIVIIGINVGTLKPDLDDVRERFSEFTFVVKEKRSSLYTNQRS